MFCRCLFAILSLFLGEWSLSCLFVIKHFIFAKFWILESLYISIWCRVANIIPLDIGLRCVFGSMFLCFPLAILSLFLCSVQSICETVGWSMEPFLRVCGQDGGQDGCNLGFWGVCIYQCYPAKRTLCDIRFWCVFPGLMFFCFPLAIFSMFCFCAWLGECNQYEGWVVNGAFLRNLLVILSLW